MHINDKNDNRKWCEKKTFAIKLQCSDACKLSSMNIKNTITNVLIAVSKSLMRHKLLQHTLMPLQWSS